MVLPVLPRFLQSGVPINWASPLNQGLKAWWKVVPQRVGGSRWRDCVGRAHATFAGNATWSGRRAPGGWGSVAFDGTGDQAAAGSMTFANRSFSLAAQAYITAVNANRVICRVEDNLLMARDDNVYRIYWLGGDFRDGGTVVANTWVHLLGVVNSAVNHTRLYINGQLATAGSDAFLDNAGFTGNVFLGSNGTAEYWQGVLDDIRVYSRPIMSDAEAMALYQAARLGYPQELHWSRWAATGEASAPAGRVTKNSRALGFGLHHGLERGVLGGGDG